GRRLDLLHRLVQFQRVQRLARLDTPAVGHQPLGQGAFLRRKTNLRNPYFHAHRCIILLKINRQLRPLGRSTTSSSIVPPGRRCASTTPLATPAAGISGRVPTPLPPHEGVGVGPGYTQQTGFPLPASSARSALARPATPCLAAQ